MDDARVRVRLDENGAIAEMEVEGHPEPEGVEETVSSATTPRIAQDDFQAKPRNWLGA